MLAGIRRRLAPPTQRPTCADTASFTCAHTAAVFDQHAQGWCGCCYLIAAMQCVEDRLHLARVGSHYRGPAPARIFLNAQALLDAFTHSHKHLYDDGRDTWTACHGGLSIDVLRAWMSDRASLRRACSHSPSAPTFNWKGFVSDPASCPRVLLPQPAIFDGTVTRPRTVPPEEVCSCLKREGPLILEIAASTLRSLDRHGKVTDLTPRPPDHAVSVVGWRDVDGIPCWIIRNSWGTRGTVPSALPDVLSCTTIGKNVCDTVSSLWRGSIEGICYLPMKWDARASLKAHEDGGTVMDVDHSELDNLPLPTSPWIACTVTPRM
jgi:hypothetical protein